MKLTKHWHYGLLLVGLIFLNGPMQTLGNILAGGMGEIVFGAAMFAGLIATIIAWVRFGKSRHMTEVDPNKISEKRKTNPHLVFLLLVLLILPLGSILGEGIIMSAYSLGIILSWIVYAIKSKKAANARPNKKR